MKAADGEQSVLFESENPLTTLPILVYYFDSYPPGIDIVLFGTGERMNLAPTD